MKYYSESYIYEGEDKFHHLLFFHRPYDKELRNRKTRIRLSYGRRTEHLSRFRRLFAAVVDAGAIDNRKIFQNGAH